jgi:hypothetical protein
LSPLHPTFQEPAIRIDDAALHSWKHNRLADTEALLTTAIHESRNPSHRALASRALVRARLWQWDAAIPDATEVFLALLSHAPSLMYIKSIEIQPSIFSYIAKSVALVGKGERHKAYRACDVAFVRSPSTQLAFLLLIKVCIPYMHLDFPQPLIFPRLSSCLSPENMTTRYPAQTTSSICRHSTRYATSFRHVHNVLPHEEYRH